MIAPKPLAQIDAADLQALLDGGRSETRTLDYKRELALAKDEDRRELARDVSAMANGGGGDIVYGVEEAQDGNGKNLGIPKKLLGVECTNFDQTKLRIENILRDVVDPRVQGIGIEKVDGFELGPIIIIRVPTSWNGPHMVSFQSQTHFFSRNNAGRHPLDVREIRAAFLAGTELGRRVGRFRDERIGRVIAEETPLALTAGARILVHLVPLAEVSIDPTKLRDQSLMVPPEHGHSLWHRFNLDGFVVYSRATAERQRSYAQAFRNGAFEAVSVVERYPGTRGGAPRIYAFHIESLVVRTTQNLLKVLRANNYAGPCSLMVTLLGVKGTRAEADSAIPIAGADDETIDSDLLLLPDVLLEHTDVDPRDALRVPFDVLWQASGWSRSFGYDESGAWRPEKHQH